MPLRLSATDTGFEAAFTAMLSAKRESSADVGAVVAAIIDDVRLRGDAALLEYTKRFDRLDLVAAELRVGQEEIEGAAASCSAEVLEALRKAAARIEDFHRRLVPENLDYRDGDGVRLGARWTAVDAVGLYVPGGTAAYPSSVLMTAIPAKVSPVSTSLN